MEYVICIVLPLFLLFGIWLAKGTQQFIDNKNAQARLDRAFKQSKEREER
jgi:hypothetical protein|tara:strand:- start:852 stop:1001 length:150 start_codon:yes stop_codon:yes gene_type:complete